MKDYKQAFGFFMEDESISDSELIKIAYGYIEEMQKVINELTNKKEIEEI